MRLKQVIVNSFTYPSLFSEEKKQFVIVRFMISEVGLLCFLNYSGFMPPYLMARYPVAGISGMPAASTIIRAVTPSLSSNIGASCDITVAKGRPPSKPPRPNVSDALNSLPPEVVFEVVFEEVLGSVARDQESRAEMNECKMLSGSGEPDEKVIIISISEDVKSRV
jgi:hypothetical protein